MVDPLGLSAFDLPKALVGRAAMWLTLVALAVALLRHGTAIVPRTRLHLLVAAYVGVAGLSAAFAENTLIAVFGERDRLLGLVFIADMAVLYLATAVAMRDRRDWSVLGGAVAVGASGAFAYGALQFTGLDPISWAASSRVRPFSTFGNPDMFGHFLSAAVAAAAALAALPGAARPVRAAAAAIALIGLALAAVAATRGVVLGLGAGALALLGVLAVDRCRRQATLRPLIAAAGIALVLVGGALAATPLGVRVAASLGGAGLQDRLLIWESALRAALDRPLLGWGPDSFGVAYARYRQPGSQRFLFDFPFLTDQAHDWVLQQAATVGFLGLALLLACIVAAVSLLLTRGRARDLSLAGVLLVALAAYWAHGLVSVGAVAVDWIPWLAFGGAAALGGRLRPAVAPRPYRRSAEFVLLAAGMLAAASGAFPFAANSEAYISRDAGDRGDGRSALFHAASAVSLDPRRAEHYALRGGAWQLLGLWREAADDFALAAELYPTRARFRSLEALARTRLALSTPAGRAEGGDRAIATAVAAVATDPHNSEVREIHGEVLFAFGRAPEALQEVVRAIELFPLDESYCEVAAAIAEQVPGPRARELLDRALRARASPVLEEALRAAARRP